MIAAIHIQGLGPHEDTSLTLDAMGHNTIEGASEQGKTLLIDAVCFCLYGWDRNGKTLDVRAIRDDADECSVTLTLSSGTELRRTLRRDKEGGRGKTHRFVGEQEHNTEKSYLGALKAVGARPKMIRQVLVPMAWQALVEGEGGGRPFRNLLADILPKADKEVIVRRLMHASESRYDFHRGDPININDAEMVRRTANRNRDTAQGDVSRLQLLVAVAEEEAPAGPSKEERTAAEAVVAVGAEWDAYDRAHDAAVEATERAGYAQDAVDDWDRRLTALGLKPNGDVDEVSSAQEALDALRQQERSLNFNAGQQRASVAAAEKAVAATGDARHPEQSYSDAVNDGKRAHSDAIVALENVTDVCPTCARPGWPDSRQAAEVALAVAKKQDEDAVAAKGERRVEIEAATAEAAAVAMADLAESKDLLEQTETGLGATRGPLKAAERSLALAMAGSGGLIEWERAHEALGERPEPPEDIAEPMRPKTPNAADAAVQKAHAFLQQAGEAKGASEQRGKDLKRLQEQLAGSEAGLTELAAEAERLDELVDAVRRAPSVAAREQLGALGDLGPVTLELPEKGGVQVLIDGRPYQFASTGRVVVADAHLRAGLRRALKMPYLPLFLDMAQSVGGQPLPVLPPMIALRTTDQPGIKVNP